jgi:hypothetical protein
VNAANHSAPTSIPHVTIATRIMLLHHGAAGDCCDGDFDPTYDRSGSNSVSGAMSAARPLFHRKRKSICDLAMSRMCQ